MIHYLMFIVTLHFMSCLQHSGVIKRAVYILSSFSLTQQAMFFVLHEVRGGKSMAVEGMTVKPINIIM